MDSKVMKEYIKKLPRYAERVKEKGVAETVEEKKEKPQEEADAVGEMIFIEGLHCNTPITLPEVAYGRFGLNYEWDLQETDEAIIKKYWRAQITAFGAKLVRAYKTTNDICQKHDILDVITAGIEAGKLTGALTPSERKQLAQCVQKARQKLSGGIYES